MTYGLKALPVLAAWRIVDVLARLVVLSSEAGRAPLSERPTAPAGVLELRSTVRDNRLVTGELHRAG